MKTRNMITYTTRSLFAFATIGLMTATSHAGPITWGAVQNISGDADVITTGFLVGAFNIGTPGVPNTTINGVPFVGLGLSGTSVTSGNFNLSIATGFAGNNSVGSANAPFSTLSAAYQAMLGTEAGDFTTPITLTISGLIPAATYQFEWWKNVSNGFQSHNTTATAGNSISLSSNTGGGADGGIGQYAIGTFVADPSGTEIITFSADLQNTFNGFQVRTIPEPGTMSLAGLGLLAAFGMRRCKKS